MLWLFDDIDCCGAAGIAGSSIHAIGPAISFASPGSGRAAAAGIAAGAPRAAKSVVTDRPGRASCKSIHGIGDHVREQGIGIVEDGDMTAVTAMTCIAAITSAATGAALTAVASLSVRCMGLAAFAASALASIAAVLSLLPLSSVAAIASAASAAAAEVQGDGTR
jgi:hypothetical protein